MRNGNRIATSKGFESIAGVAGLALKHEPTLVMVDEEEKAFR
jgi:hypothetical protein